MRPVSHLNLNLNLDPIASRPIALGDKGLPPEAAGLSASECAARGYNILAGDLPLPVCVLNQAALAHNRAIMREFTARMGVKLAPHGKTTMAPQLMQEQLADGAWGMTAATPAHLFAYRSVGIPRILYANQLVDPVAIDFVLKELARDAHFEFVCLVDSVATIDILTEALNTSRLTRPLDILIELGIPGGRTGVRRVEDAVLLARHLKQAAPLVRLRGLEAFEGIVGQPSSDATLAVDKLLQNVVETMTVLLKEGLVTSTPPVISVGGSAFFGRVAERLRSTVPAAEIILRSGCYITNDHGMYEQAQRAEAERGQLSLSSPFQPALEVWAYVQSRPEPGLAILTLGKRDISYDIEMPLPIKWSRRGTRTVEKLGTAFRVASLNDQHARLLLPDQHPLAVGDRVGLGCSHPCTTFDKWKYLYRVDDRYTVTDLIATLF
jgi:D-serine deaminase-like pyridoxal phosphate-dependent protein